jgi:alpha-tubulin suppressor-like RCC1 family protein
MASELLLLLAAGKPLNVWSWGYNEYGMNGQNTLGGQMNQPLTSIATAVASLPASGNTDNSGYVKSDGSLWVWGDNSQGSLGLNNLVSRSSPTQLGSLTNWSQLAIGDFAYMLARKTDGTIWSWGANSVGELGQNNDLFYSSPVQIGALTTWTFVAAGSYSSYAIKGGALWVWGDNQFGQLGRSSIVNFSSPVQVGALTTWSKIIAGNYFAAGLTTSGALWMWGYNGAGQLGSNTTIDRSSPVQVTGGGVWTSVALSEIGTAAVKSGGTLWQWGQQLAFGNWGVIGGWNGVSSPVQIGSDTNWASVYGCKNGKVYVAIRTNGTAWVWGENIPTLSTPYAPSTSSGGLAYRSSPTQIGSATNWSEAFLGPNSIFLKDTSNNLYSAGFDQIGSLGVNKVLFNTYTSPVNIGVGKYVDGTCSEYNSLFVRSDKTLWEAGATFYSQPLGTAPIPGTLYSSPVQVGLSSNWSKVFANCGANFALTANKDLYGWGVNGSGQLGLGNTSFTSAPTQISGTWEDLSQSNSGCEHVLAYKFNPISGIYGWGRNTSGQLGVNNIVSYSSPVLIGNITSKTKKLSAALFSSAFITSIGDLYTMGSNTSGQLGRNNRINASNPVQVTGALYNDVSVGSGFMVAIRTNGTLWAWGSNLYGQLGQNNGINRSSPVQIGADTNWEKVFSGSSYWVATKTDKTVWACGIIIESSSPFTTIFRSSPVQVASNFKVVRGNASDNYNVILVK